MFPVRDLLSLHNLEFYSNIVCDNLYNFGSLTFTVEVVSTELDTF